MIINNNYIKLLINTHEAIIQNSMTLVTKIFLQYWENTSLCPFFRTTNLSLRFDKNGIPLTNPVLNSIAEIVRVKFTTYNFINIFIK